MGVPTVQLARQAFKFTVPAALSSIPFFPQTTDSRMAYKRPTYTRTKTQRKRKAPARKANSMKRQLLAVAPKYHFGCSDSVLGATLLHNNIYTMSPTQLITQGTGNTNRQGDAIYMNALRVNGLFSTPDNASDAFTYRILVVKHGDNLTAPTSLPALLSHSDLFLPNTGNIIEANSLSNPKSVTILYDQTVEINSVLATSAEWHRVSFNVPLNTMFQYQGTASTFGKSYNLYICLIGCVFNGASGVSSAGTFTGSADLIFQNL